MDDAVVTAPLGLLLITIALSSLGGIAGCMARMDKGELKRSVFTFLTYLVTGIAIGILVMFVALWRKEIPDAGIPVYVLGFSLSGKDLVIGIGQTLAKKVEQLERYRWWK